MIKYLINEKSPDLDDSDFFHLNYFKNSDSILSESMPNINDSFFYSDSFPVQCENLNIDQMNDIFKNSILNGHEKDEENQNIFYSYNKEIVQHLENEKEIKENITQQNIENINLNLFKSIEYNKDNKIKQKRLLGKKLKNSGELDNKENKAKNGNKNLFTIERDSQRKIQLDNYSINLFEAIYHWIKPKLENQIPKFLSKYKINPPDYKAFTHNTNYNYIRFFLDIKYKYILQMNKLDKEILDQLFILLKIKKPIPSFNKKENELTNDEYNLAKKLLKVILNGKRNKFEETDYDYLYKNEIDDTDKVKIKSDLIKLLIKKGYKNKNEEKLLKKDIFRLNQLFVEYKLKNSKNFQNKNKILINEIEKIIEIKELNMTLREIIIQFFNSGNDFQIFYENKVKDIDINFELQNKYSLSKIYINKENNNITCGFIKMVENKTKKNIKEIQNLAKYFSNKNINQLEIKKYIENYKK